METYVVGWVSPRPCKMYSQFSSSLRNQHSTASLERSYGCHHFNHLDYRQWNYFGRHDLQMWNILPLRCLHSSFHSSDWNWSSHRYDHHLDRLSSPRQNPSFSQRCEWGTFQAIKCLCCASVVILLIESCWSRSYVWKVLLVLYLPYFIDVIFSLTFQFIQRGLCDLD